MKFDLKAILENSPLDTQKHIITNINQYLYTNYEGIGTTRALGQEFEYVSDFHKFWEKKHKEILNPTIDKEKCAAVAEVLHELYLKYGKELFEELYDTRGLPKEVICKIRFFTANQDFRGSRKFKDFAEKYLNDPSLFDIKFIYNRPGKFLEALGLGTLSQTDKRVKYAKTAAEFLLKNNLEPYDLFSKYANEDYLKLREILTNLKGSGFGNKKTDMFLRDMRQLGVWGLGKNYDKIDVASDINTVKVALRTGILKTDIPLVSSFLDIFCHQYTLIDEMNAKAWRRVWEIWKERYPNETIESPCQLDYLIYKIIGKELCKENLFLFECEKEHHQFYWHTNRNQTCQICYRERKQRNPARVVFRDLPCRHNEGKIYVLNNRRIQKRLPNLEKCPFEEICKPKSNRFRKLRPPKSISILGRTGWITAVTRTGEGGGGLMS